MSAMALVLNPLTLTLSLDYYPRPYQLSRCPLQIDAKRVGLCPVKVAGGWFLTVHYCCGPMTAKD